MALGIPVENATVNDDPQNKNIGLHCERLMQADVIRNGVVSLYLTIFLMNCLLCLNFCVILNKYHVCRNEYG